MEYLAALLYWLSGITYLNLLLDLELVDLEIGDLEEVLKMKKKATGVCLKNNPLLRIIVVLIWPLPALLYLFLKFKNR